MVVTETPLSLSLIIKLKNGLTESGAQKYKKKTINNVKVTASKESIYALAEALSTLLAPEIEGYSKVLTSDISSS